MDRLTTGRRYPRAGSVTVSELLVRQASPAPCSESSPAARDDVTAPVDVVPAAHRRDGTRGPQLVKIASIGVATAMLCGAVAFASMIGQQRREVAQPSRPVARITGGQALLPDRLDRTLPVGETTVSAPVVATPAPAPEAEPSTQPLAPAQPPVKSTTAATASPAVDAPTDLDLVREFYENLPTAPAAAFDLLEADLLNTSLGDFLHSWSLVRAIEDLQLVQRSDGVLATVRIRLADGGHLRLTQLLTVAESPRRIVGVQLLSAQRN